MVTKKQIVQHKKISGLNRVASKRNMLIVVATALSIGVSTFLVRHYAILPHQDRLRFQEAERAVDQSINNLGANIMTVDSSKQCRNTSEKYSSGSPFCTYAVSFKPIEPAGLDSEEILNTIDGVMSKTYEVTFGQRGHAYKKSPMGCIIEIPGVGPKTSPADAYTLKCSSYVTRYVY